MVADDDGLLGLGDGDALSALGSVACQCLASPMYIAWALRKGISYSSGVEASVLSSGQDKALAGKEEALGECLVFGGFIALDNLGDDLELIRPQLQDHELAHVEMRQRETW